ncbi:hypothetical protein ART_1658 [Arthrobacter sp. PAMC 25486]|uniref:hypothetical protein n=1 Tax=Arthrobacter sp. PAMC 25486 TaxID=1494608 RepID=UPI000535CB2B|nr:hypothetical protein [Arthrobacter sp. PAMC 25486]AIY01257.1 hypothetical protein ART_1658 [Arthrobacter sp. PAMC 25486]
MRRNIVAGGILTALIGAMLSVSPAMAEESPTPPAELAYVTMTDDPTGKDLEFVTADPSAPSNVPTQNPPVPDPVADEIPAAEETTDQLPPAEDEPVEPEVPAEKPVPDPTSAPAETPAPAPATPVEKPAPVVPVPAPVVPVPVPAPKAPAKTTPKSTTPPAKPAPAPPTKAAKPAIAVTGAIATHWKSLKGVAGALGAPTSAQKTTGSYVSQQFVGGTIFATTKNGVQHILKSSPIGKIWFAKGESVYGFPVSGETATAQGTYQKFSTNHWIFTNGNVLLTTNGIGSRWVANGGLKVLGAPTSMESCGLRNNGCSQSFAKAVVYWSKATGAQAVWGGILGRYKANGATANYIGYPTSKESCTLINNGCYQNFERGLIMWSAPTGAYAVPSGAIRNHYGSTGTAYGFLGYPNANETCDKLGCTQRFQGGTVYWSGLTGAQSVKNGKLHNAYKDRNSYKGVLGFPRAGEVCGQLPKSGCYQDFSNGRLWSNTGQTYPFRTNGGIGAAYYAKGGPNSNLGYPLSDEKCSGGQCAQTFQGGAIGWGVGASGTYGLSECQNLNDGRSRYSGQGSKHVLLTFTETYRQAYATNVYCKSIAGVYVTEWRTDGYVGASGFKGPGEASGPTRNLYSPTGSFTVTEAFGLGNPGTALSYRTLNPNSRWGGNPWTPTYNKYHESSKWEGWDENMWYFAKRSTRDYEQGAVINYNRPNITQDAGFAIFLHQNKVPTAGCISIDNWAMVDYLRKSVPGDRIIMGVRSAIFK